MTAAPTDDRPASRSSVEPRSHGRNRLWLVLLLSLAALVPLRHLSEQRRADLQLRPRSTDEAAGLWETVMTSGTGAFRAFANIATWKQITDAESNREYFRLIELYRTIQRLQPRNVRIQRFLADQLIDTIAPQAADREQAWEWIEQGHQHLEAALQRNPWSHHLHDALGVFHFRKFADYPVRLLRRDLAAGERSLLAREPFWLEFGRQTLADHDALPEAEQEQLQHAVDRIGYNLVYSRNLTEFSEYNRLPARVQRVYRRLDAVRTIVALLAWERGADPASGVPAVNVPRMARWAGLRVDDVLLRRDEFDDPKQATVVVWEHAVRMAEWLSVLDLEASLARGAAARFRREMGHVYADFPPPADSDVAAAAARYFGDAGGDPGGSADGGDARGDG